jgi:hypothetical protein
MKKILALALGLVIVAGSAIASGPRPSAAADAPAPADPAMVAAVAKALPPVGEYQGDAEAPKGLLALCSGSHASFYGHCDDPYGYDSNCEAFCLAHYPLNNGAHACMDNSRGDPCDTSSPEKCCVCVE